MRAKKQNEEDIKLVMGADGWDPYRRAFAQEDIWCPWSSREMRVLLTDEERVALGGIRNLTVLSGIKLIKYLSIISKKNSTF